MLGYKLDTSWPKCMGEVCTDVFYVKEKNVKDISSLC